jgi:Tol biopolymer transport system component
VERLVASVVACLLLGACTWTDPTDDELPSGPVATLVAYTVYVGDGDAEVWVARVDGRGRRRLVNGNAPKLSPDGRWVAFERQRGSTIYPRDLMLVPASGGRPRLLMRSVSQPLWSPDSKQLAVLQFLDERRSALLSITIETGERTTIARGSISDWSFSPRGDEIAYVRADPSGSGPFFGESDVYIADVGGGSERRVTEDGDSAFAVWGPHAIAYARLVPYRGWGAHEIWLVRPDGGGRRLLTKTPWSLLGSGIVGLIPIAWSADGRALLAALSNEFGGVPFAVDPQLGSVRRVGELNYGARPAGLSRDGRFVLVSYGDVGLGERTQVAILPYRGGPGRIFARRAGDPSWNR